MSFLLSHLLMSAFISSASAFTTSATCNTIEAKSAHPRPMIATVQVKNHGQSSTCCFRLLGTADMTVVVARPNPCMSEFWISSQESGPDVEPGSLLVEVWNSTPRGVALTVMVHIVHVRIADLRYFGGQRLSKQYWEDISASFFSRHLLGVLQRLAFLPHHDRDMHLTSLFSSIQYMIMTLDVLTIL